MPIKDPKEIFTLLLSNVRNSTERGAKIFQELSQVAQDADIKEALEARAFVAEKTLAKLDRCFQMIGEQPMKLSGRLHDIFVEDFRKELSEIQSPLAKRIFLLAKASHLIHLRVGELVALTAAADLTGNYGVGVLLESCLGDTLAFAERGRRMIRRMVEAKVEKLAA